MRVGARAAGLQETARLCLKDNTKDPTSIAYSYPHHLGTKEIRLLVLGYYWGAAGAQFGVMPLTGSARVTPPPVDWGERRESAILLNTRQSGDFEGRSKLCPMRP
jgi:hypothetical protein